jgi:hypothetical protein
VFDVAFIIKTRWICETILIFVYVDRPLPMLDTSKKLFIQVTVRSALLNDRLNLLK